MAVGAIRGAHQWLRGTALLDALVFGVPYVVITLYLLRGAPHLMEFSYPEQQNPEGRNRD